MIVGAEPVTKLHDKYMKAFMKSIGATQCPKCQLSWEQAEGKLDPRQKDEKGNPLTKYNTQAHIIAH